MRGFLLPLVCLTSTIGILGVPVSDVSLEEVTPESQKLICYYNLWSQYRSGVGKFTPQDIDPELCTHIIVSFIKINDGVLDMKATFEGSEQEGLLEEIKSLTLKNPSLKVLVSAGGFSATDSEDYVQIGQSKEAQEAFTKSVLEALKEHKLAGFVVNWEFLKESDEGHFLELHQTLREGLGDQYVLGTVVSSKPEAFTASYYNLPELSKVVNFLNIITYDFHGYWDNKTGHNAPLYAPEGSLSFSHTLEGLLEMDIPKEKVIMGFPTYGRSFTLADPENHEVGAAIQGPGEGGALSDMSGALTYFEICKILMDGASYKMDDEAKVPYAVQGDQWISFDDMSSIEAKTRVMKDHGLQNAFVWALGMDDFTGTQCQEGMPFPLIRTLKNSLQPVQEFEVEEEQE